MTKKKDTTAGNTRVLRTKVKKKRGLKESSRRWLERHLNDPYVQRSKADGYRSRAAYKLIEIDDKHHLLKPGQKVIDLGAAPGGWCQVAAVRTKSSEATPHVVGIDYLEMDAVPGAAILQMDFLDEQAPARLVEALGGEPDIVLSDMAAPTTGHRRTDHIRTMHLCEVAADFAVSVLKPGGHSSRYAQALVPLGSPCQATRVARRIGRALSAGQGLQGTRAGRGLTARPAQLDGAGFSSGLAGRAL